jgi:hypothetical protein
MRPIARGPGFEVRLTIHRRAAPGCSVASGVDLAPPDPRPVGPASTVNIPKPRRRPVACARAPTALDRCPAGFPQRQRIDLAERTARSATEGADVSVLSQARAPRADPRACSSVASPRSGGGAAVGGSRRVARERQGRRGAGRTLPPVLGREDPMFTRRLTRRADGDRGPDGAKVNARRATGVHVSGPCPADRVEKGVTTSAPPARDRHDAARWRTPPTTHPVASCPATNACRTAIRSAAGMPVTGGDRRRVPAACVNRGFVQRLVLAQGASFSGRRAVRRRAALPVGDWPQRRPRPPASPARDGVGGSCRPRRSRPTLPASRSRTAGSSAH